MNASSKVVQYCVPNVLASPAKRVSIGCVMVTGLYTTYPRLMSAAATLVAA